MFGVRSCLFVLGAVLIVNVGVAKARPANDKDTVTDIHLNTVVPDKEKNAVKLVEGVQQDASYNTEVVIPSSTIVDNLELVPEEESTTTESSITIVTQRPSYFSRLIQSIFDIPISVLQSVRNLIQTTTVKAPQH